MRSILCPVDNSPTLDDRVETALALARAMKSHVTFQIATPKASASTLLVLSGPVVMWRKKTRWTPICAIANAASATGTAGA